MPFFWKEVFPLLYRTTALYFVAFLVFRMMGKRSLGKMAPFDVAVIKIIGDPVRCVNAMEPPILCIYSVMPSGSPVRTSRKLFVSG
ncbi:MAG: hypothetical protein M0031_11685 [Thermaerobacter sp.]|jgi:uncharacterized membrane protein YcaP (DUF421 family)|nr:hypothetical protein [Thermaerobacter sp.]